MLNMPDRALYVGAGLLLIAAAAYVSIRGIKNAAGAVGAGAVGAVVGTVGGVVVGVGDAVGVPRINETECEKAKREGRTWDASFACPAGDWLRYVFS